jgi:UDP-N-acetylglucosamine--N-acetylmuramyl-(pentapeptide) pyrophosphoryl-undecaprenol N-acetylglucosamine transferase
MSYRLLVTAGGTGGHIFPALALAKELKSRYNCEILFAGGKLSSNTYFLNDSHAFHDIRCSSSLLKGTGAILKGVMDAVKVIRSYKPDAIVGFGSYYTLPVLIAAKLLGVPLLLHEANSIPGRVNRLFSPFAAKTWIYFPEAKKRLKGVIEACNMPLREQFKKGLVEKKEACAFFQLNPDVPTLLVFGGSQGAKGINALFSEESLLQIKKKVPSFQGIHLTGSESEASRLSKLYAALQIPFYVRPFETRIDAAVTRAGASSIAEQLAYKVPGISIPFPGATDDHQKYNAHYLESTGLGIKLDEKELDFSCFAEKIASLMHNRDAMKGNFNRYKMHDPGFDLSDRIIDWIKNKS